MAITGSAHARLEHQLAVVHRTARTLQKRAQEADNLALADDAWAVVLWCKEAQQELLRGGRVKVRLGGQLMIF